MKKLKDLSTVKKLAFTIGIIFPLAIIVANIFDVFYVFQKEFPQELNLEFILTKLFIVVGASIVLIRVIKQRGNEKNDSSALESDVELIDTRESPIWDFSYYPNFPLFGFIVTFSMFVIGSIVFFMPREGYELLSSQLESRKWPTTQGIVSHSKVLAKNTEVIGFEGYKADIRIEYIVAGKKYQLNLTVA